MPPPAIGKPSNSYVAGAGAAESTPELPAAFSAAAAAASADVDAPPVTNADFNFRFDKGYDDGPIANNNNDNGTTATTTTNNNDLALS